MTKTNKSKNNPNQGTASDHSTAPLFALILICFFISGLTGLIYQILWVRMIVKIIGSAPFAVSIVLTVFMGGLGLGSYLAGRVIDRVKRPLKLVQIYGLLELCVGAYGLIVPLLLIIFQPLYSVLYNRFFENFFGYNLLTFLGCTFLLILPVTCMGATLPVLSRFFVSSLNHVGTRVGRLYGLNTIGAAVGSLLCGFWLINGLGVWGTLVFAIFLNTGIGISCLLIGTRLMPFRLPPVVADELTTEPREEDHTGMAAVGGERLPAQYPLIIFAVSGFCAMAYEVVWVKLLGLIVGPTTYSFTIVLTTFITGLALGSIFFGWLADKTSKPMALLVFTQVAAALSALLFSQVMGNSQIFFSKLIHHFKGHFAELILIKSSILFIFMFLPTFCLGAAFPLVAKTCTRSLAQTGRTIGFAYAINTIGAVLGSFCAGFIFIPLLGKEQSLSLVIALQLLTALIIGSLIFLQKDRHRLAWPSLVIPVLLGCVFVFYYPHWDRKQLSRGKYHRFVPLKEGKMGWLEALFYGTGLYAGKDNRELVYYGDGIGGFTTVLKTRPNPLGKVDYMLLNSGKVDASSAKNDMVPQTLFAHFPMLFHPQPDDVLVLGLASGITSGEILHYPVKRLDTVEINSQVVAASDFFIPWNNRVLSNPKAELIIQDGRAHLELTQRRYDVIISEPSNPWMAGLATLFTREFMELAKSRLKDGGIFVQWIHSYQMDWPTFALVGRTFSKVFPNGLLVTADPGGRIGSDFLLVGLKGDGRLDVDTAVANFPYAKRSTNMKLLNPRLFYNLILSEDLEKVFGHGVINTDNRPWLEFKAPKLMYLAAFDQTIANNLYKKRLLSEETASIVRQNRTDIDSQIDFAEYAFSFNRHSRNMVDLSRATAQQKERFEETLKTYCASNIIRNFSFITDDALRKECVLLNIKSIREKFHLFLDKAPVYYHIGLAAFQNDMAEEAIQPLFEAVRLNPKDPKANAVLKKALAAQQMRKKAIATVQKQLKQDNKNPALYYQLGNLYGAQGDLDQALIQFETALSIEPEFTRAITDLAGILAHQKAYEKAITCYKKALALEPRNAIFSYIIACLYALQNKTEDSIDWLKKAIQQGYDDWWLITTDKDLENIRGSDQYRKIIEKHK